MSNDPLQHLRALSALVAATVVVGCGGGSDDPPPPPAATTATISGKALNGRLQGATACYDTNANRACDPGEPATSVASDANGNFEWKSFFVSVKSPSTALGVTNKKDCNG